MIENYDDELEKQEDDLFDETDGKGENEGPGNGELEDVGSKNLEPKDDELKHFKPKDYELKDLEIIDDDPETASGNYKRKVNSEEDEDKILKKREDKLPDSPKRIIAGTQQKDSGFYNSGNAIKSSSDRIILIEKGIESTELAKIIKLFANNLIANCKVYPGGGKQYNNYFLAYSLKIDKRLNKQNVAIEVGIYIDRSDVIKMLILTYNNDSHSFVSYYALLEALTSLLTEQG